MRREKPKKRRLQLPESAQRQGDRADFKSTYATVLNSKARLTKRRTVHRLLVLYRNSANAYPLLPPTRYSCGQPNLIIKVMAAATRSNLDYAMIAATFTFWPLGKIVTHLPYPCAQKRLYSLQSTLYTKRTGSVFDKLAPTSSWSSRSNLREEARSLKTTLKPVCMCARNVDTSCSAAGLNTSTLPRGRPSPRPSARIACPKRRRNGEPTRCPVGSVGMDLATSS